MKTKEQIYIDELEQILKEGENLGLDLKEVYQKISIIRTSCNDKKIKIALLSSFSDGKTSIIAGLNEKIEDNMIVQNNGTRYLMAVECEGINYDLMSEMEKVSVEQGFIQFLNTLRHPIQIYTQTRTVDIEESIQNYKNKLDNTKKELEILIENENIN